MQAAGSEKIVIISLNGELISPPKNSWSSIA